jgi:hypothetical protein
MTPALEHPEAWIMPSVMLQETMTTSREDVITDTLGLLRSRE